MSNDAPVMRLHDITDQDEEQDEPNDPASVISIMVWAPDEHHAIEYVRRFYSDDANPLRVVGVHDRHGLVQPSQSGVHEEQNMAVLRQLGWTTTYAKHCDLCGLSGMEFPEWEPCPECEMCLDCRIRYTVSECDGCKERVAEYCE